MEQKPVTDRISKIVNIYVILLVVGFPLFMTQGYYDIQNDKMYYFLYLTIACLVLLIAALIYGAVKKDVKGICGYVNSSFKLPCFFSLCFLGAVIISTFTSEWLYESFWGNMGRSMGCFMWIFYVAAFLLIAIFYRPKKWHIDVFLAAGLIVCGWGVLDFYYLSPIGWQEGSLDYTVLDFSSTIGNVNLLTSVEAVYIAAAAVMFIGTEAKDKKSILRNIYYYVTACCAFMGLTVGFSDNALIAVAAILCFVPFYAFKSGKRIVKFIALVAGYLLTMLIVAFSSRGFFADPDLRYLHRGVLLTLSCEHTVLIIAAFILAVIALIIGMALVLKYGKKADGEWKLTRTLRAIWASLGILAFLTIVFVFVDANLLNHADRYGAIADYVILDEDWGTNRGFNWRLAIGYMRDFPIIKLIFGTGPDTYAIYTVSNDFYNMQNMFNEVYDSPHNEPLQMLFTTGFFGFVTYYLMLGSSVVRGFKSSVCRIIGPIGAAMAYSVLTFVLVSFVNICTPINVPMVILAAAIAAAAGREAYGVPKMEIDSAKESELGDTEKIDLDNTKKTESDDTEKAELDNTEKAELDDTEKVADNTEKGESDNTKKVDPDNNEESESDNTKKAESDDIEKTELDNTEKTESDNTEKTELDNTEKAGETG